MEHSVKQFRLELMQEAQTIWLTAADFSISEESENFIRYCHIQDGHDLSVEIRQRIQGAETLSTISVQHNGSGSVRSVQYPIEEYRELATFDRLLMSSAWGDDIPRPSKTIHDVSTSTSIRFDQDYIRYRPDEIIYFYPSIMAMQYMTVYNPARTRYLATYSTADETMTFHAKSTGKYSLELFVTHYPFLKKERWVSPECGRANLEGGWHCAADLYRSHMAECFLAPDTPEWLDGEYHGWCEYGIKYEKEAPRAQFSQLEKIYQKECEALGMNHLFLVGWHDNGHDTQFPRYLPCEQVGTAEELRAGIESIHRRGGRVSLYTNARLIDIYGDFYREGGKNAVSLDETGKEYHEDYHTESLYAVSCPGCPEYAQHMAEIAERISGEYGADGMFVDQISCNLDPFCYNPDHGHTKPSNNFLPGVETELTGLTRAARKRNPAFHTFAEGCHERLGQFYDVNQGHGEEYTWQIGRSLPEQFLYTYPNRIVTGICGDKQQLYHAMAQFKALDIKSECRADPSNHPLVKRYISLRKKYPDYFFQAEFLDDEGFLYEKGIRLFAVRARNGSTAVCLWKPGAAEETSCRAKVYLPDGVHQLSPLPFSKTEFTYENGWAEVTWTGALTYFILE